ncbi:uncharacterized protein H6S33_000128 [Morchella sextelata]|uniref:uncharacterized protein n=1 Tax=Morchella sextelata TaxID=1174677 RepID=UPI001D054EF3|nr:uncharacterized protein H6S33_000128 [Morchella sextelata]KAH0614492.1 hypothetical protein H6S33_000128 [Morchella sextelata]
MITPAMKMKESLAAGKALRLDDDEVNRKITFDATFQHAVVRQHVSLGHTLGSRYQFCLLHTPQRRFKGLFFHEAV